MIDFDTVDPSQHVSTELRWTAQTTAALKSSFIQILKHQMATQQIGTGELQRRTGLSRSVVAAYMSPRNPTLPTMVSIYKLSMALGIDPLLLLPRAAPAATNNAVTHFEDAGEFMTSVKGANDLVELISKSNGAFVYYFPRTIPEFIKRESLFRAEHANLSQDEVTRFRNSFMNLLDGSFNGAVILDENVLKALLQGTLHYADIPLKERLAQFSDIMRFLEDRFPMVQVNVANYTTANLSPLVMVGDEALSIQCFHRSLSLRKSVLHPDLKRHANQAFLKSTNFIDWWKVAQTRLADMCEDTTANIRMVNIA